jgi:hypothetical protein
MKQNGESYKILACLIYLVATLTDRYMMKIPNLIFIVITVFAAILMVIGLIKSWRRVDG